MSNAYQNSPLRRVWHIFGDGAVPVQSLQGTKPPFAQVRVFQHWKTRVPILLVSGIKVSCKHSQQQVFKGCCVCHPNSRWKSVSIQKIYHQFARGALYKVEFAAVCVSLATGGWGSEPRPLLSAPFLLFFQSKRRSYFYSWMQSVLFFICIRSWGSIKKPSHCLCWFLILFYLKVFCVLFF